MALPQVWLAHLCLFTFHHTDMLPAQQHPSNWDKGAAWLRFCTELLSLICFFRISPQFISYRWKLLFNAETHFPLAAFLFLAILLWDPSFIPSHPLPLWHWRQNLYLLPFHQLARVVSLATLERIQKNLRPTDQDLTFLFFCCFQASTAGSAGTVSNYLNWRLGS